MSMFRAYMYKLLRSPFFYIGILGAALVPFAGAFDDHRFFDLDVLQVTEMFLDSNIIALFGALPFAANFADEWNSGTAMECITRCGTKKYVLANVLFCFATSIITVFAGLALYECVYSCMVPFYYILLPENVSYCGDTEFVKWIRNGHPVLYAAAVNFMFSCKYAIWSMIGLMVSAVFPNKYVALCIPVAASYFIERMTFQFPFILNIRMLACHYDVVGTTITTILYVLLYFAAISAIFAAGFYFIVRKRVRNEIT